MAKNKGWWSGITGELSKLRLGIFNPLGWKILGGSVGATYTLDTTKVDVQLARSLYNNTNDDYKLGAAFARPIVNTTVGFMGLPSFSMSDENAQEPIDAFFTENTSKVQLTLRNACRDGDSYVWVTREDVIDAKLYPEDKKRLIYNIIPPEQVKDIKRDPLTNRVVEYVLEGTYTWTDENKASKRATITQYIDDKRRRIVIDGDVPDGMKPEDEEPNPWGFIPIVHFANESDEHEGYGRSDLEAIEPYMKAYHDVMLHAIKGSKLHSTPRLKIQLRDVAKFLANNFGVEDPVKWAQQGGTIDLNGHELLFFGENETAEFVEVKSATGDAAVLLEFLFYCIVDVSETPEFAFGVHTPSSLASTKEQMPILIRRISRKRGHFDASFKRLVRIVLAMTSAAETTSFSSYSCDLDWDDIDPRDGKDVATEIKTVADALKVALESAFISQEAAVDFFSDYVSTMNKWDDPEVAGDQNEKSRIMRTRIRAQRLEDAQMLDDEKAAIDAELARQKQKTA